MFLNLALSTLHYLINTRARAAKKKQEKAVGSLRPLFSIFALSTFKDLPYTSQYTSGAAKLLQVGIQTRPRIVRLFFFRFVANEKRGTSKHINTNVKYTRSSIIVAVTQTKQSYPCNTVGATAACIHALWGENTRGIRVPDSLQQSTQNMLIIYRARRMIRRAIGVNNQARLDENLPAHLP